MPTLTFDQAQDVHRALSENGVIYPYVRGWAADRLINRMREWFGDDHGFDVGSSDVSIALTEALASYEVPLVGPVIAAYKSCGFTVPSITNA